MPRRSPRISHNQRVNKRSIMIGMATLFVATIATGTAASAADHDKVFVCKYEGTPGVDERLQSGNNPIDVDYKAGREPGGYFNDAQGRSYVLAYDTGQPEPSVNDCPPPDTGGGTTTTTEPATTTTEPATTTTTEPATTT